MSLATNNETYVVEVGDCPTPFLDPAEILRLA